MPENIKQTLSEYEKNILNRNFGLCFDCDQPKTDDDWCQDCNSKRFQEKFSQWNSGNKSINELIKGAQLKARNRYEVIEWIPYNRLENIQELAKGGFSTIYKAVWLDGRIQSWDSENEQWKREAYGTQV